MVFVVILSEAVVRSCPVKNVLLEISQNSQEKHLCQSFFFDNVADLRPAASLKRDPGVGVSCEF